MLSVDVINTMSRSKFWKKRLYLAYMTLQGSHVQSSLRETKAGPLQEQRQEPWKNTALWLALDGRWACAA